MYATKRSIKTHNRREQREFGILRRLSAKWGKNFLFGIYKKRNPVGTGGYKNAKIVKNAKKLLKFGYVETPNDN